MGQGITDPEKKEASQSEPSPEGTRSTDLDSLNSTTEIDETGARSTELATVGPRETMIDRQDAACSDHTTQGPRCSTIKE